MKIPCKGCLILPVCRQKAFVNLIDDCEPLRTVMYDFKKPMYGTKLTITNRRDPSDKTMHKLHSILSPPNWLLEWDEGRGRYKIMHMNPPKRRAKNIDFRPL